MILVLCCDCKQVCEAAQLGTGSVHMSSKAQLEGCLKAALCRLQGRSYSANVWGPLEDAHSSQDVRPSCGMQRASATCCRIHKFKLVRNV